jgi:hypothetical protein
MLLRAWAEPPRPKSGTGIDPDLAVPLLRALREAHSLALKRLEGEHVFWPLDTEAVVDATTAMLVAIEGPPALIRQLRDLREEIVARQAEANARGSRQAARALRSMGLTGRSGATSGSAAGPS